MWLLLAPLIFILPACWLLKQPRGLRKSLQISAWVLLLSCVLRYLPCMMSEAYKEDNQTLVLLLLHASTLMNAAILPLFLVSPSVLAITWYVIVILSIVVMPN